MLDEKVIEAAKMAARAGVEVAKFPYHIPVLSRLFVLSFSVLADKAFVDHAATDVASLLASDQACLWPLLAPFTRWDAVYYLNIAKYGYTSESQYAFFPFFPYCIRFLAHMLEYINKGVSAANLSDNDINYYVMAGLLISNVSFVISSWLLWQIFSTSRDSIKKLTLLLFSFNPGNIFFSTVYTESFYTLFTFSNVLVLEKYSNIGVSLVIVSLSALVRSNGVFNGILLILHMLKVQPLHHIWTFRFLTKVILLILFLYFLVGYSYNLGAVHVCSNSASTALICNSSHFIFEGKLFYNSYQLIQHKHWGVGFFSYYQLKNIPNFLLAAPIFCICVYAICRNYKKLSINGHYKYIMEDTHSFNVIYMTALLAIIIVYAHIQIITRVICSSCPYLYYDISLLLTQNSKSTAAVIIGYFVVFNIAGVVMHSNHFPWT